MLKARPGSQKSFLDLLMIITHWFSRAGYAQYIHKK